MTMVGIREAKTHFSRLLRYVAAGEEIVITNCGRPVARLVQIKPPVSRELGRDRGLVEISDDFDAALPDRIPFR